MRLHEMEDRARIPSHRGNPLWELAKIVILIVGAIVLVVIVGTCVD